MKYKNLIPIGVHIEDEELKEVRHIAVDECVSPSQIIREAVHGYLEQRKSGRPADTKPAKDPEKA